MNTDAFHPAARRARHDAIDALGWAARIDTALRELGRAESPLSASQSDANGGGGPGGHSDPTGERVISHDEDPREDAGTLRRQLLDALHRREDDARTIARILYQWAGEPTDAHNQLNAINDATWCAHHLTHQSFHPRKPNGSRYCTWCDNVKRNYNTLPTAELIRAHDTGRRISDNEYRTALTDKAKRKKNRAA